MKTKYWGSGVAIKAAINKYGANFFTRGVVDEFETRQEAIDFESMLVNADYVSSRNTYNLIKGGGSSDQRPKGGALTKGIVKYGKDNVSYYTPPWERSEMTSDSIQVWKRLPELYTLWINAGKPKRRKLTTLYQRGGTPFSFYPTLDAVVRLFKNEERYTTMLSKYTQWKANNFEKGD
jgi:hypothetical protein